MVVSAVEARYCGSLKSLMAFRASLAWGVGGEGDFLAGAGRVTKLIAACLGRISDSELKVSEMHCGLGHVAIEVVVFRCIPRVRASCSQRLRVGARRRREGWAVWMEGMQRVTGCTFISGHRDSWTAQVKASFLTTKYK